IFDRCSIDGFTVTTEPEKNLNPSANEKREKEKGRTCPQFDAFRSNKRFTSHFEVYSSSHLVCSSSAGTHQNNTTSLPETPREPSKGAP
ncbi:MAG: hypothetical protein ACOH1C_07435, partial [Rothia mucilaginosa]|uniref:hypothetical protein n=1 Tax=Rothia mucilaginosa TaxID=43675 RepID=UPI003B595518